MRTLSGAILLAVLMLSSCQTSVLRISTVGDVPSEVQEVIGSDADSAYTLQLINNGEHQYYIVYRAKGTVTARIEAKGDKAIINFDQKEENQNNNKMKHHVYQLTIKPERDTIAVYINGEEASFDRVTGL